MPKALLASAGARLPSFILRASLLNASLSTLALCFCLLACGPPESRVEVAEPPRNTAFEESAETSPAGKFETPRLDSATPPQKIVTACEEIGGKLGSVDAEECLAAGVRDSGSYSVEGRLLLLRDFVPPPDHPSLGRVFLIGGIHGDEYSTVSIMFKWMGMLQETVSVPFHLRVAPLVNPDGLLRRRSQRQNSRGVDLNRNFPSREWATTAIATWKRERLEDPRHYPGPFAGSEPETRFLVNQIEAIRPSVIVSVHAPYSIVDFDGPDRPPQKLGPLSLHQLGTFPGSLGRYAGVHGGLPVVTIELPHAGIMPTVELQTGVLADLLEWIAERLADETPRKDLPPSPLQSTGNSTKTAGSAL